MIYDAALIVLTAISAASISWFVTRKSYRRPGKRSHSTGEPPETEGTLRVVVPKIAGNERKGEIIFPNSPIVGIETSERVTRAGASPAESLAMTLPTELWDEIFELLDYSALKSLMCVCRRLAYLLEPRAETGHHNQKIDGLLFRDKLPENRSNPKYTKNICITYELHPLLKQGFVSRPDDKGHIHGVEPSTAEGRYNIEDLFIRFLKMDGDSQRVWDENCICPVRSSVICFCEGSPKYARDHSGTLGWVKFEAGWVSAWEKMSVTVFDIMVARLLSIYLIHHPHAVRKIPGEGVGCHRVDRNGELRDAICWLLQKIEGEICQNFLVQEYSDGGLSSRVKQLRSRLAKYTACRRYETYAVTRKG